MLGESEIGTLEHFGRKTGTRHLTPVHPVATADGFRIVVPLAEASQWAMNVLAAGHCRLQLHDTIFDLDEPVLVEPVDVRELTGPMRIAARRSSASSTCACIGSPSSPARSSPIEELGEVEFAGHCRSRYVAPLAPTEAPVS